jgi:hypothetical protein
VVGGLSYQQEIILFYQLFQQWDSVRYCNYSFFEVAWHTYSVLHLIIKSLIFLRIIHRNNSIYVYLFWKVWTKFIKKQGNIYDKNKPLRRFHTKKMTKSISQV